MQNQHRWNFWKNWWEYILAVVNIFTHSFTAKLTDKWNLLLLVFIFPGSLVGHTSDRCMILVWPTKQIVETEITHAYKAPWWPFSEAHTAILPTHYDTMKIFRAPTSFKKSSFIRHDWYLFCHRVVRLIVITADLSEATCLAVSI